MRQVRETYGMNNHVHFPNENLLAGRPVEPVPNKEIYAPWHQHVGFESRS